MSIISIFNRFAAIDCAGDEVLAGQLLKDRLLKLGWLRGLDTTVHSNRLLGVVRTPILRIPCLGIPDSASGALHVRHLH